MRLEEWPLPYVRVKCAQCEREGRLSKDGLLERFGGEREMFVVRAKLTEASCKRENKKSPCMSILPDALLVQAIRAERKEDILSVEIMQEAANWNPKWLEEK
ncbi:hypothetical protein [Bradyrhizobium ottawaense]|uniref:Uncharacterized protein n=1 Tax=Bradyrhizobium ottawaense TaxID=931866 RepID=A0ABY0QHM8_9BRAD|nr:hypothetical protein [Bradyrhizobium ottawaense]SDK38934.1 hypothetical protein SAMN05444163_7997 [Bradyrhizobium ottawaense]SDK46931.1 hypothetical protein SAMN05444163_8190 [Bradyrhizobium ottawaense]